MRAGRANENLRWSWAVRRAAGRATSRAASVHAPSLRDGLFATAGLVAIGRRFGAPQQDVHAGQKIAVGAAHVPHAVGARVGRSAGPDLDGREAVLCSMAA